MIKDAMSMFKAYYISGENINVTDHSLEKMGAALGEGGGG